MVGKPGGLGHAFGEPRRTLLLEILRSRMDPGIHGPAGNCLHAPSLPGSVPGQGNKTVGVTAAVARYAADVQVGLDFDVDQRHLLLATGDNPPTPARGGPLHGEKPAGTV